MCNQSRLQSWVERYAMVIYTAYASGCWYVAVFVIVDGVMSVVWWTAVWYV